MHIVDVLSKLDFGLSFLLRALVTWIVVVDHMSIKPFSIVPTIVSLLFKFQTFKVVCELLGRFKSIWEIHNSHINFTSF